MYGTGVLAGNLYMRIRFAQLHVPVLIYPTTNCGRCEEKMAESCTRDCPPDWFVSGKKAQTTLKCSTSPDTKDCSVDDITKNVSRTIFVGSVAIHTALTTPGLGVTVSLTSTVMQVQFAQEYLISSYWKRQTQ